MSIELFDNTGAIGQAATNSGFKDAGNEVEKSKTVELKKLFKDGVTKDTKTASQEALDLAHKVKDNGVRSTLINVSKLLKRAKEFCVVNTG
jgi:hypothetical protein